MNRPKLEIYHTFVHVFIKLSSFQTSLYNSNNVEWNLLLDHTTSQRIPFPEKEKLYWNMWIVVIFEIFLYIHHIDALGKFWKRTTWWLDGNILIKKKEVISNNIDFFMSIQLLGIQNYVSYLEEIRYIYMYND